MGRLGLAPRMGARHCRREQYIHPAEQLQLDAYSERDTVAVPIAGVEHSVSRKRWCPAELPVSGKRWFPAKFQTRSGTRSSSSSPADERVRLIQGEFVQRAQSEYICSAESEFLCGVPDESPGSLSVLLPAIDACHAWGKWWIQGVVR